MSSKFKPRVAARAAAPPRPKKPSSDDEVSDGDDDRGGGSLLRQPNLNDMMDEEFDGMGVGSNVGGSSSSAAAADTAAPTLPRRPRAPSIAVGGPSSSGRAGDHRVTFAPGTQGGGSSIARATSGGSGPSGAASGGSSSGAGGSSSGAHGAGGGGGSSSGAGGGGGPSHALVVGGLPLPGASAGDPVGTTGNPSALTSHGPRQYLDTKYGIRIFLQYVHGGSCDNVLRVCAGLAS